MKSLRFRDSWAQLFRRRQVDFKGGLFVIGNGGGSDRTTCRLRMRSFDATQGSLHQWVQWGSFCLGQKLQHWRQIRFKVIKEELIISRLGNGFTRASFLYLAHTFSQLFTPFRHGSPVDAGKLY
jgi:hypothetical protein